MRNKHVLELRVRIEPHPFDDVSNERLVRVVTKSIVQVGQVEVALKGTVEVCDHAAVGTLEGAVPDQTACPWFRFEVLAQGGGRRAVAGDLGRWRAQVETVANVEHVVPSAREPSLRRLSTSLRVELPH